MMAERGFSVDHSTIRTCHSRHLSSEIHLLPLRHPRQLLSGSHLRISVLPLRSSAEIIPRPSFPTFVIGNPSWPFSDGSPPLPTAAGAGSTTCGDDKNKKNMSDILHQATIFPPSSLPHCHPDPFDEVYPEPGRRAQDKSPAKDLGPAAPAQKHDSRPPTPVLTARQSPTCWRPSRLRGAWLHVGCADHLSKVHTHA